MRSFVLPLAVLVASALAAPKPAVDCTTKGNTVVEFYDVTVTETIYVTEGAIPAPTYAPATTTRKKHTHKPSSAPVYVAPPPPAPTENVVTITYGYQSPAPAAPTQVYNAPAPSPEPQTPTGPTGDFIQDMVNTHNKYRAAHGAPPVSWNQELASYAEGHNGDCVMHHTGGPYGENLAFGYSDGVSAITAWYDEQNQYNYGSPGFQGSTGHFTQVVWKATKEIGCHLRQCGGSGYLMCEYQPAGNMVGNNGQYFSDNVSP
jgi:uncharacterized protein YkwD